MKDLFTRGPIPIEDSVGRGRRQLHTTTEPIPFSTPIIKNSGVGNVISWAPFFAITHFRDFARRVMHPRRFGTLARLFVDT